MLAREAGCSSSLIWQLEKGYRPGDELSERIAAVLGCTVEQLFEQVDQDAVTATTAS
jgi:transcriptional regulator with XRE-family HTH domain